MTPLGGRTWSAGKCKVINDPVHGHMEFEAGLVKIIDTKYFQRLRELKQLGSGDWVFPGAVHNRFIHSLGVCYLANLVMERILKKQSALMQDLDVTDRDRFLVALAGLCHDLGHGPYSHGFERVVQIVLDAEKTKKTWHHEDASVTLFEAAVEESGIDISPEEREYVIAMIRGVTAEDYAKLPICGGRQKKRPLFCFQIVANKQTGMDVDKYDYLLRDAMFCGAKIAFDISRLLRPEVRTDEKTDNYVLAYYRKEEWMIHQLFRSRFDMHHQVYGHSVVVAFQLMLEEVLVLSKDWLRISEAIQNPELYVRLTDAAIHRVECLDPENPPHGFTKETLSTTQDLIHRIKSRCLYTSIVGDLAIKLKPGESKVDKHVVEADLRKAILEKESALRPFSDDFLVVVGDRDFTRCADNPLLEVPFYLNRGASDPVIYLRKDDVANSTQPAKFWERYARIYVKHKSMLHLQDTFRSALDKVQKDENTAAIGIDVTPAIRGEFAKSPGTQRPKRVYEGAPRQLNFSDNDMSAPATKRTKQSSNPRE
ncbi:Deoxynucleoside triphosphate triphosphohydrolase SAMHD1-like protein [Diplonema papillatum]|nr:Deoxynucleoside triphosphate triphosphohydrolase SAMHD1-like protein [Diplonema papillatum]